MSFRWRLFLGLSALVLITATVYSIIGYYSFQRSINSELESSFNSFTTAVQNSIFFDKRPRFNPDATAQTEFQEYSNSSFRLLKDDNVELEYRRFPTTNINSEYLHRKIKLDNGYILELAFYSGNNDKELKSYLRTNLLALPIALVVALLTTFFLHRLLLHPLRALQRATTQLSKQAIPEPVAIPPGNDELSHLAESYNNMTNSLQSFIERERGFTRYASHELRTPLSNLKVLMEGLQKGIVNTETAYPQIEQTIKRMEDILTGLLTLTRSPKLNPEPILLEQNISEVVSGLSSANRARVNIIIESSPIAMSQDDLIKQVILNLLSNALKYSEGSVEIILKTTDQACIIIRDYGQGVPNDALSKLSEPFFRLDTRKAGLGLGLALTKHIVKSMNGTLQFTNASPGLKVTVSLPLAEIPDSILINKEDV
ncbi:MAG TPA: HAMP domain-containing histidine kinase [Trueperaceae bacterium]|nr:HAMP domain-containing histidine kinase [Trueperaceae bacterium]